MAALISRWDEVLNLSLNVAQQTNKIKEFEILSSDAERVAFLRQKITFNEIDWIKKYFEQSYGQDKKCKEKAAADRQKGNKLFQKKQYKDAVHKYTQSVVKSPTNTEELALAYGNRSAAWFHQQEYMNCLEDINEAIKNGYPSTTLHKLDIRQANCCYRLQDWDGASRALERFAHHLDEDKSLTDKRRGELLKEAKDMGIKVEKARSEVCQISREDRSIPTVSYGQNSVLVQATCAINMMYNRSQGRYLVAHQDIKAGDTLIVEKPFAAVLLPDHYKNHCHHCFVLLHSVYPCPQCTKVRYCSPRCQEESWSSYHQTECLYLGLLHSVGIAHLSLRIVLVAGLQFLIDFRSSTKDLRTVDSIAGLTEEGRYERNYLTVYELMTHTDDISTEDLYQYSTTALLLLKILQCSGWFDGHTTTETVGDQDLQTWAKPECTCSSGERNRTGDTDTDSLISDQALRLKTWVHSQTQN